MSSFLRMHSHYLRLRKRGGWQDSIKVYPGAQLAGQEHSGKDCTEKHLALQTGSSSSGSGGHSGSGGGLVSWQCCQ